jgi:hypothetical protein
MRMHRVETITPQDAQPFLAQYLKRSEKKPALHPDAWLATEGVRFGPRGGPTGGWAVHHLRRIEAGLRGESLLPESREELLAKFGEDAIQHGIISSDPNKKGDDTNVEGAIAATEEQYAAVGKNLEDMTEAERRKARKEAKKKRRLTDRAERGQREEPDTKRQKKNSEIDAWADSAAASAAEEVVTPGPNLDNDADAQTVEDFQRTQEILEGEVGEREAAHVIEQGGEPPAIVEHDAAGEVAAPKKQKKSKEKSDKKTKRREKKAAVSDV